MFLCLTGYMGMGLDHFSGSAQWRRLHADLALIHMNYLHMAANNPP